MWGHEVAGRHGPVAVTRAVYNEKAGADTPEQPEVPVYAQHVWDWWWELNSRRPAGFESLSPIPYAEIESWKRQTGRIVDPVETDWLIGMDNAWLSVIAEERQAKRDRERQEG